MIQTAIKKVQKQLSYTVMKCVIRIFLKKKIFIKKAFIFTLTRFDGDVWEEIPSFLGQNFFIS